MTKKILLLSLFVSSAVACDSSDSTDSPTSPDGVGGKADDASPRDGELCTRLAQVYGEAFDEDNAVIARGVIEGDCTEVAGGEEPKLEWRVWYSCESGGDVESASINSRMYYDGKPVAFETTRVDRTRAGEFDSETFTGYGDGSLVKLEANTDDIRLTDDGLFISGVADGDCLGAEPGETETCEIEYQTRVWADDRGFHYEGVTAYDPASNGPTSTLELHSNPPADLRVPECS